MAINFLNKVDFNQNELDKARIVNEVNDTAAGTPVDGQLYYNTTDNVIKVGEGGLWVSISGDITEVQESTVNNRLGIDVVNPTGPIPIVGLDIVGLSALGAPALTDSLAVYDVSATTNKKLTVADIIGTSTWKLEGDGANPQTIVNGDIVDFVGNTYISSVASAVSANNFAVTLTHDNTTRTNTTSTVTPVSGATFTALDSITTNATGHVTAVNTKTITTADENYTLPVTAGTVAPGAPTSGKVSLTGSTDGVVSTVEFIGTTGRIDVTSVNQNNGSITIDLTDDVTIVDDLTVGGIITQTQAGETNSFASQLDMNNTKLLNVATGSADTDGVNWGQVRDAIAGVGLFQGGYNATTGLTVNLSSNGSLDGANNIELDKGDYFVVTTAGTAFYGVTLEVGDMIFANVDIAANSNPAQSVYTTVIQDANIAGAGATDGATQKGVAGFDSANFDVTASGWVQLNSQRNPYGAKQSLNNTAPSSRAESGGVTTFTIDLAAASLFGTGALSENVKVEVTEGAAPYETVYACVTRSGSASLAVGFTGSIANNAYQVLLTHV